MLLFLFNIFPTLITVLNKILRLEFFKHLEINFVCVPTYVIFVHLYLAFLFCVLLHYLFDLFCLQLLYHIYYYILFVIVSLFFLFLLFIGYDDKRLVRYSITVREGVGGEGQESFEMMVSVTVGFLYMLNTILLSS